MPDFQRLAFPLAVLTFLSIAVYFYGSVITLKPRGVHAWAQSDRLALAYGFQGNHFNLLRPATLSAGCEHQVTGVELPLQSYAAALIGAAIGKEATHIVFRLLTLSLGLTSILVLFRYLWQSTGNFVLSLFPGVFLLSAPVFAYYAAGFIPDIAGISFMIPGFVALLRYFDTGTFRYVLATLAWLTLAALVKMSLSFLLFFTMLWLVLDIWQNQRSRIFTVLAACLCGGGVLIAQYFYIHYLDAQNHCGVFIAAPNPPTGKHLLEYFLSVLSQYRGTYISLMQEWIGLVVLIATIIFSIFYFKKYRKMIVFTALPILALLANFLVMGVQLEGHNYYALVTFFPAIIWIFINFARLGALFFEHHPWKIAVSGICLCLYMIMLPPTKSIVLANTFFPAYDEWLYLPEVAAVKKVLAPGSHIVVAMQTAAPNLGLVYFGHIGISDFFDYSKNNDAFFKRVKARYFIMEKSRLAELEKNTPQYRDYLTEYYHGKGILVFEYKD